MMIEQANPVVSAGTVDLLHRKTVAPATPKEISKN